MIGLFGKSIKKKFAALLACASIAPMAPTINANAKKINKSTAIGVGVGGGLAIIAVVILLKSTVWKRYTTANGYKEINDLYDFMKSEKANRY